MSNGKLTASDWATIVTLFERGEKNVRDLAVQFGVSHQAISKGIKDRGITKGSRLEEVMHEADDVARRERERRVKQANIAVEQYAKYFDAIVKLTMKKIIEGSQIPGGIAGANAEILALKNAVAIVRIARLENWDILQIEELLGENAELPDLNVGEYTLEEIDRIKELNEESYLESLDDEDDELSLPEDEDEDEDEDQEIDLTDE